MPKEPIVCKTVASWVNKMIPDCLTQLDLQFSTKREGQLLWVVFSDPRGNKYRVRKLVPASGLVTVYLDDREEVPPTVEPPTPGLPAILSDLPLRLLNTYSSPFKLEVFNDTLLVPYQVISNGLYFNVERSFPYYPTDYTLTYESE